MSIGLKIIRMQESLQVSLQCMMKTFGIKSKVKCTVPVSTIPTPVVVTWIVIVSPIETSCVATLLWIELDLFKKKFYKDEIALDFHSEKKRTSM